MTYLPSLAINTVIIACSIVLHYEVLNFLSRRLPTLPLKPRARIIAGVASAVIAHSVEAGLFAFGYWVLYALNLGALTGDFDGSFADYMYFSYAAYTTVGFGDVLPTGDARWMAGVEALTGFVLITWTASYLYLEMSHNWRHS